MDIWYTFELAVIFVVLYLQNYFLNQLSRAEFWEDFVLRQLTRIGNHFTQSSHG